MRKARSLIAAFLVVLIQITPGPLGLRPAQAAIPLAAVAVGALITSGLVAGAGIYKPASTPSPGFSVDPVTATMHLPVIAAVALGASKYGQSFTLDMDFAKWTDYTKAHPTDLPTLSPAVIQAWRDYNSPAPVVGTVFAKADLSRWKILTISPGVLQLIGTFPSSTTQDQVWSGYWGTAPGVDQIGGYRALYGGQIYYGLYSHVEADGRLSWWFYHAPYTVASTNDPVNPPVTGYTDPIAVAAAVPLTAGAQDDAGKIVAGNPGVVTPATVPAPFSAAQISAAQAAATAAQAATAAAQAQTALAQDTTNTALQVAAAQAQAAADQAAIAAQAAEVEVETQEDTSDIPYNPSALGGPYTLPEIDFGARFQTFIDAIKATSFFSLPASIASGIPASSISVLTIDGGETIGTHNFDFADMDNLWAILRSVVLTGFMFVSIRIVCLHR